MTQTTRNYGRVLYELGVPKEAVAEALNLFRNEKELKKVLESPVVQVRSKLHIIDQIFKTDMFPKVFVNFLKKVCENHRMQDIEEIFESYTIFYNKAHGIIVAQFYYVTMPDDAQIEKMKQYLCRKYQARDAQIRLIKDESLIGGFRINVDNTEYDYSMKGRLDHLKQKLTWR